MDSSGILYGSVAVLVACVISAIELLQRYERRKFSELANSGYFIAFLALNAIAATIVYCLLPWVADSIKADVGFPLDLKNHTLGRGVAAGILYSGLIRTSIFDFKYKGESLGAGLDAVYKVLSNYILLQHETLLSNEFLGQFLGAYAQIRDKHAYLQAVYLLKNAVENGSGRLKNVDDDVRNLVAGSNSDIDICQGLFRVIFENTADLKLANDLLKTANSQVSGDAVLLSRLSKLLT